MQSFLLSILSLTALASSTPLLQAKKLCQEYTLPLNITSLNYKWALDTIKNDADIAAYNSEVGRRDALTSFHPFTAPTAPTTAVYTISGTFCQPADGGNGTALLATHGGGFGGSYWAPSIQPEKYSFADYAVAQGYSIFYYDRPGIGKSENLSGYVAQAPIYAGVIKELVKLLHSDKFGSPASKVALVGHSLGSAYSTSVLHSDPDLVDAAILTGIAYNISNQISAVEAQQPRLANLQDAKQWGHLDGGWVNWVDIYAGIQGFFKAPFYDPKVAQWAQDNRQPNSVMEQLSLRVTDTSSPGFTGPVLLISGEYDYVVCGGYCPGVLEQKASEVFPASKNLVTYSQPGSGHGINLSLNATGSFKVITNFLKENGIQVWTSWTTIHADTT